MNLFEKFRNITNISIRSFYEDIIDFFDNYHQDIVNYYVNYNATYPTDAFNIYESICKRLDILISKISFYKENFNDTEIWDLIEELDTFKLKLDSVKAYPRLYRVNFVKKQNQQEGVCDTYVMTAHDTLESVARDYNQSVNDLMLINELQEENYSDKGGVKLILKNSVSSSLDVVEEETVFDILIGKNILGKDIPNYFEIDDSEEDLIVMTPEQTFLQSTQNLFKLKQGEIPEYPDLGVTKNIYMEVSQSDIGFTFPIMLRQLMTTLATDDTILNFEIGDIDVDKETKSLVIQGEVQNRLLDSLKFVTPL